MSYTLLENLNLALLLVVNQYWGISFYHKVNVLKHRLKHIG